MSTEIKPTSKELKEIIRDLKAVAYDTISQMEYNQGLVNDYRRQLGEVNDKIQSKIDALNIVLKEEEDTKIKEEKEKLQQKNKIEEVSKERGGVKDLLQKQNGIKQLTIENQDAQTGNIRN